MRTILFALAWTLLAGAADAQQRPVLNFDPNRIEFATHWAQSSPCLGDTSDPVCLAETMVVCGFIEHRSECVRGRHERYYNPQRYDRVEYRIARAGIVPFERLEEMQENLLGHVSVDLSPMTARRATVAQFLIRQSVCFARDASCEGSLWTDILVVVERTRRGWIPVLYGPSFHDTWFAE